MAGYISKSLEARGYDVSVVSDGREICRRLGTEPYAADVLIVGTQTLNVKGLELVRCVRTAGYEGAIIIHAAGYTDDEVLAYRRLGVTMFVSKRWSIDSLFDAVDLALAGRRAPAERTEPAVRA